MINCTQQATLCKMYGVCANLFMKKIIFFVLFVALKSLKPWHLFFALLEMLEALDEEGLYMVYMCLIYRLV
jgi:hypothetical protein